MQIASLPAMTGRRWVFEGFSLLRRYPVPLLALTFLYLLLLMASTLLPLAGPFAPMLLTPLLAIGVMHAVRSADRGQTPGPSMLFAGFREAGGNAWRPLLVLGVANAVSTLAALAFASIADGGTLLRIATGQVDPEDPALREGSLVWASVLFMVVYTPVQASLWYAPMFVAWHRIAPLKAMFFSLVAVLRNKGAFFVYLLSWFLVALVASLAIQAMKLVLGASPLLISLVLSPLSLLVLTALYCSFWPTYRDAVQEDEPPGSA
jgi:uncharacterized membrane protein